MAGNAVVFTKEELMAGEAFLRKVAENGGFWPNEATFRAASAIDSKWAPELLVLRRRKGQIEILLAIYKDSVAEFRGQWHIPGGYGKIPDGSYERTCNRIFLREVGIVVEPIRTVGLPYLWKPGEHPYGFPLSIFTLCEPKEEVKETESLRYFPINDLPSPIVKVHGDFIEEELIVTLALERKIRGL